MIFKSKVNKKPLFLVEKFYKKKKLKKDMISDKNKFLQVSFINLQRKIKTNAHFHLKIQKNKNIK